MAQAKLKHRESKTLELEPLPIVIEPPKKSFWDLYDDEVNARHSAETEEPSEPVELSPQEKQVINALETLQAAVNGDAEALEKIRSLPNVGLLDLEQNLEGLGYAWETLNRLFPDRVHKTADLIRESLSGNENAWVELQKEWTGREPTAQQRKGHAKDPFGNWFRAERSFELWGIPTRPQEHLNRGKALQDALVKARHGDLSGLTKLGIDKNDIPNQPEELISLLSPDRVKASPEVMIPGVGPVGKKPGAGSGTGITPPINEASLVNEAENIAENVMKLDPAILAKLGLDRHFLDGLRALFGGWIARGGPEGRTPNNGADGRASSDTPNASNTTTSGGGSGNANGRLGFAATRRDDSGGLVGTRPDTSGSGGATSGGAAAPERSGAAESGAEKPDATPSPEVKKTSIIYSNKGTSEEVLGHKVVYSDASVKVNWSNGTTSPLYKSKKEYEERDRSTDPGTASSEGENTTVTVEHA